jgi:two-component system sensor histidine kinase PilS (NtrC family)
VDAPARELDALLRAFSWARLAVAAGLVGVSPWAPAVFRPAGRAELLLAVVTLVVASSGACLVRARVSRPRVVAWLLCLLDATLVTAVVAVTGGARSILVFLYVLLVTAACLLLSRRGALTIALVASALYAGLVLTRNVVPAAAFGHPVDPMTAFDVLAVLTIAATLTVVSIVAGGLTERFLLSQRELAHERRTLGDLQAFSDVILQSVGTGLIALDRSQRITAFNRAAEKIAGVRTGAVLGARWADVFGPGPPLPEIESVIAGAPGASVRQEIELRRPNGTLVPVRVVASALEASDGSRLGCIASCEDLSPTRAMEARMRQADRLATLGRMAANIAHEIRNPLASLSGAVEALAWADVTPEMRGRLTEIVVRESERLSSIIGNFLEYARPAHLTMERVDAATVLEGVLRALPRRRDTEGVKVVRAFPASMPIEADRERLRQALWILCRNALDAMPAGGELRIDGRIRAGVVEITVTDTGDGIASRDLAHVFEPFFATRHDPGGLGLAVVHRIVTEHRGEVTVRSERGLGAEFTLRFPERHA